ncbi:MAG: 16S rRNA processing protein RimM [Aeromicrobium sp.]|nr:16S rRNA processing protein RimM [Aeromicrobium sp.]
MAVPFRTIGRTLKPHGTNGEVSVSLTVDLPAASLEGLAVYLIPPGPRGARAFTVTGVRGAGRATIVRFDDDSTAAQAGALAGRSILVAEDALPEVRDEARALIGYVVSDERYGVLGSVDEVIETGANDVLVVTGGSHGQILVPVIPDVIRECDDLQRTVRVHLLDGLLEVDGRP